MWMVWIGSGRGRTVWVGDGVSVGRGVSVGGRTNVIVGGPAARERGQDEHDPDDHRARHCGSHVRAESTTLRHFWLAKVVITIQLP